METRMGKLMPATGKALFFRQGYKNMGVAIDPTKNNAR